LDAVAEKWIHREMPGRTGMKLFESNEIYMFAMRIEENGEKFYRHAAKMAKEKQPRTLFTFLADEEVKHKKTFENMLGKMERRDVEESYPGEYLAYLQDYLDNKIVFSKSAKEAEYPEVKDTLSAIDFAIQREINAVLYYHEVKRFVAVSQQEDIEKIIEEERRHFSQLTEMKKNVARKT
jgi:rubrerythrin